MNKTLPVLFDYISTHDWAMKFETMRHFSDIIERHVAGVRLTPDEMKDITAAKDSRSSDNKRQPRGYSRFRSYREIFAHG